jgi:hypothetical protein
VWPCHSANQNQSPQSNSLLRTLLGTQYTLFRPRQIVAAGNTSHLVIKSIAGNTSHRHIAVGSRLSTPLRCFGSIILLVLHSVRSKHSIPTAVASCCRPFTRSLDLHWDWAYEFMPLCPSIVVSRRFVVVRALVDPQQSVCSAYLSRCSTCCSLMVVLVVVSSSPNSLLVIQIHSCGSTALPLLRGFVSSCLSWHSCSSSLLSFGFFVSFRN